VTGAGDLVTHGLAQLLEPVDINGLERLDQATTLPRLLGEHARPQHRGGGSG
jgi:hypothetical protein